MYDAIIIGARCAGAPTAMLLARQGYRVLLVDRATFPSDLPHGHFIHRQGPARLKRWGLLDRVVASGCPPIRSMSTDFGDFALVGQDLVIDDVALGYAPRRSALDAILVEAAVAAGAELRQGFAVEGFLADGDRITGIRGRDRGGASVTEQARITIGADGRNSRLARAVGAPAYDAVPPLTCWYFSYWSDVPPLAVEVAARPNLAIFAFPTNDALFGVFVAWPIAEFAAVRSDIEGCMMAAIDRVPALAERLRAGRRVERLRGTADLPNFLRRPHGPGWALVGDAGHHKDPYLALGVSDAFRDAEMLAAALDDGWSDRVPMEEALAGYERQRNEAALPEYQQNLDLAALGPFSPRVLGLRRALRDDQEATNRFYMATEGMIPPADFFNPATMGSLMARAGVQ
jgi:flavin-dependent dehydrogenase